MQERLEEVYKALGYLGDTVEEHCTEQIELYDRVEALLLKLILDDAKESVHD
jgi:hypothetical protein